MCPPTPLPNSYWLADGQLLAGEYPGDRDPAIAREKLSRLLDAGITCFIDLTECGELRPYEQLLNDESTLRGTTVRYVRHPIRDLCVPCVCEMQTILDEIDRALAAGMRTYVHCWGGVGRTGTVVGCYLARCGLSGEEALREVARLFATTTTFKRARHPDGSPETCGQKAMVRAWPECPRGAG